MNIRYNSRLMGRGLLAGLALVSFSGLQAGDPVIATDVPQPVSLNGEWDFRLVTDLAELDALEGFEDPDYDASGFDRIPVPANWNLHGFEDPHWVNGTDSEGFYRTTFRVPEVAEHLRTELHFGGVWVSAEVWVNGEPLGQHDSGFTAFAFEISDKIKPGEENILAVRVRQQLPNNLFKFDANDDWGLAGIYRDVWLEFTPEHLYLSAVEVETDFDADFEDADLNIRAFVIRDEDGEWFKPSPPFEVRAVLKKDSAIVAEKTRSVTVEGPHNGRDVRISIPVRQPLHWTAETPNLYDLEVEVIRDGNVVHSWTDTVGFREISTEGGVFRINGHIVKLRGVNRHDLHPEVGRATRHEDWLEDIKLMQEGNINAVRCAHYPPAEGFIRLCDELGMYVLNEIPLGFGGDRMGRPEFAGGMLLRIHETIQRDRNRPSVIVWDFGNEDPLTYLHLVGIRTIKGLDSSRPLLLPFRYEEELPPEVDILAPHYWKTPDYDRLAASAQRPIISTEYTHAIGSRDFGELGRRWEALTSHPAGAGAMIWLWADQGLLRETTGREVFHPMEDKDKYTREGGELVKEMDGPGDTIYDSHGNYGTDGIVNADRSPQRDFWEAKAVYAPVRILVDSLDFKPGEETVRIPVRNEYDFTNLDTVDLAWSIYRDHLKLDAGSARLEALPHTTAWLEVPTAGIDSAGPADVLYIEITARRPDDSILVQESVRLETGSLEHPRPGTVNALRTAEEDGILLVSAGPAEYAFNPRSGEIQHIRRKGELLASDAGFVCWRPSTYAERNRYDKRDNAPDWNTFMQGLEPECLDWQVKESGQSVRVTARSKYRHDDDNFVLVDYHYTVAADGSLQVDFTMESHLDVPELPEIGLSLGVADSMDRLVWVGEGPLSSVPGKTAATRFGWWATGPDGEYADGTKSGLEYARLDFDSGNQLYFHGQEGVRLVGDGGALRLRILTTLGGAWTKNGPPENPEWHLDLSKKTTYSGTFKILPLQR